MSDKNNDDVTTYVSRRSVLRRSTGVAAIGAASLLASPISASPAGAAPLDGASASGGDALPGSVAGIRIPDSALARETVRFARGVSSVTLFNHVMRTYLYSALLFDRRGVRYDCELAFVAAVLHDLGLLEAYQVPAERFEVGGADAAERFLKKQRMSDERVAVVWDAIALHTNMGIASRKRPEIAMVSVGSAADFAGQDLQQIPSDALEEILDAFPREGFKQDALDNILSICRTNPMSVAMHPFAEVGRRHIPEFPVPTVEDMLLAAPFEE
ncbi:HD domain-containing protein [Streptomyces sp. NPDC059786]|uniref:HD domain-containing protein n=1 Tax=Streptomyces sp. NPDC059786 TaxID=3346946 RepID=UPI00364F5F48